MIYDYSNSYLIETCHNNAFVTYIPKQHKKHNPTSEHSLFVLNFPKVLLRMRYINCCHHNMTKDFYNVIKEAFSLNEQMIDWLNLLTI